jgi:hypothetical protein
VAALVPATAHAAITTEPNRSRVALGGFDPAAAGLVELVRNGLVIGRSSGTGSFTVNGSECWTAFTPQMLPGDTVRIGGQSMTVQGPLTVAMGPFDGVLGTLTATGNATGDGPFSVSLPDAGASSAVTAGAFSVPFTGLTAQPGFARLESSGGGGTTRVDSDDPSTPPAATGCPPFNADAVTAFDAGHLINGAPVINAGNVGQALTTAGPTGAGDGPVTAGLGGTTVTGTATNHTWSAQFSAGQLAALPEGELVAGQGSGATLGIFKDTVAPPQPTSSPPPGRYLNAPTVSLAAEPGSRIHFTVDGSQPTPASPTYTAPVRIGSSSTIKAFAVDAVGNPGPVAALAYQLGPGAGAPGTNPGGSNTGGSGTKPGGTKKTGAARITVLKVSKRLSLKRLRKDGLGVGVQLAPGTTAVRFMVSRRVNRKGKRVYKLVASVVRTPGASRYRARLNARALGLVKVGLYRLKVLPGLTRTTLDQDAARTIFLRVVR